ncbi:hypothetical protein ColTof4_01593 [Colletotrichum tofieldiae]|nr:hypothetical protein ColTof3_10126 [Colletotrichum tofieldiae]GKT69170.1 hypothetical protein ColTof4_01593 [Colletotrichum tofieldiae]GKT96537.1 hypothetical protein Ct61P_14387 [Colletotrichum tofieldiae]
MTNMNTGPLQKGSRASKFLLDYLELTTLADCYTQHKKLKKVCLRNAPIARGSVSDADGAHQSLATTILHLLNVGGRLVNADSDRRP